MKKRGIGHVEFILAFLIFAFLLLFVFYFFSPLKSDRLKDSSLSYTVRIISNSTETTLNSYSIKINDLSSAVVAVKLSGTETKNTASETYYGNVLGESKTSGSDITYVNISGNDFVIIKASEEIDESNMALSQPTLNDSKYYIASLSVIDVISAKKIKVLSQRYNSDYSQLKQDLNIPRNVDFAFGLRYSSQDEISAEREIPKGVDVLANTVRTEILKENGGIVFADFWVKVW